MDRVEKNLTEWRAVYEKMRNFVKSIIAMNQKNAEMINTVANIVKNTRKMLGLQNE